MNRCQIAAVINISRWLNKCSWCVMLVWWRRHHSVGPMAKKKLLTASFRNAWGISELWGLGVIQEEWTVCKCDKMCGHRRNTSLNTKICIPLLRPIYWATAHVWLFPTYLITYPIRHILSHISYPTYPTPPYNLSPHIPYQFYLIYLCPSFL